MERRPRGLNQREIGQLWCQCGTNAQGSVAQKIFQHERCAPVARTPGRWVSKRAEQGAPSPRDFCDQIGL